jgi:two-component system response regulator FixJ
VNTSLIAVVDDDDRVLRAVAGVLRSMGYATRSFASGAHLLDGDMSGIDCILSDDQMPVMSGLDLLAAVRMRAPALPVIIMTGHVRHGLADKAARMGAAGFIEKPLDDALLARLITSALA